MAGKANGRKARNGGGEITMSDIARHAGVSPMTVSRALSDPASVSDKMRRKVDATVRQFGYLPNRIAGSLSSKRSNVVGLVVPSIRNSLYAAMIHAISDVARANGLHLMIANSGHRLEDEEALVSALLAAGEDKPLGGFIREFDGLTSTAKARKLAAVVPGSVK